MFIEVNIVVGRETQFKLGKQCFQQHNVLLISEIITKETTSKSPERAEGYVRV